MPIEYTPEQESFIKSAANAQRLYRALEAMKLPAQQAAMNALVPVIEPHLTLPPAMRWEQMSPQFRAAWNDDRLYWMIKSIPHAIDVNIRHGLEKGWELAKWVGSGLSGLAAEVDAKLWANASISLPKRLEKWGITGQAGFDLTYEHRKKTADVAVVMPLLEKLCAQHAQLRGEINGVLVQHNLPHLSTGAIGAVIGTMTGNDPQFQAAAAAGFANEKALVDATNAMMKRQLQQKAQAAARERKMALLQQTDTIVENGIMTAQILLGAKNPKAAAQIGVAARVCYTVGATAYAVSEGLLNPLGAVARLSTCLPMLAQTIVGSPENVTHTLLKDISTQINELHQRFDRLDLINQQSLEVLARISKQLNDLNVKVSTHCARLEALLQVYTKDNVKRKVVEALNDLDTVLNPYVFNKVKAYQQLRRLTTIMQTLGTFAVMVGAPGVHDLSDPLVLSAALIRRGTISRAMALLPDLAVLCEQNDMPPRAQLPEPYLWAFCAEKFLTAQVLAPEEIPSTREPLLTDFNEFVEYGNQLRTAFRILSSAQMYGVARARYQARADEWSRVILQGEDSWAEQAVSQSISTVLRYTVLLQQRTLKKKAFVQRLCSSTDDACRYLGEVCGGYEFPDEYKGSFGHVLLSSFFTCKRQNPHGCEYKGVLIRDRLADNRNFVVRGMNEYDLLEALIMLGYLHPFDEMRDLTNPKPSAHHKRKTFHHGNYPAHEDRHITFRFAGALEGVNLTVPVKTHNTNTSYRGDRYMLIDASGRLWQRLNGSALHRFLGGGNSLNHCHTFVDLLLAIYRRGLHVKMNTAPYKQRVIEELSKRLAFLELQSDSVFKTAAQHLNSEALFLGVIVRIARWRRGLDENPIVGGVVLVKGEVCRYEALIHDFRDIAALFVEHYLVDNQFGRRLTNYFDGRGQLYREEVVAAANANRDIVSKTLRALEGFEAQKDALRRRYHRFVLPHHAEELALRARERQHQIYRLRDMSMLVTAAAFGGMVVKRDDVGSGVFVFFLGSYSALLSQLIGLGEMTHSQFIVSEGGLCGSALLLLMLMDHEPVVSTIGMGLFGAVVGTTYAGLFAGAAEACFAIKDAIFRP